ncbi:unnamed protein product [Pseudo-nitzschia multistriata]|uniref:Sialate O-acetylesterase domain-containing protein n=1 Tax=Pseudo-nitzschia multistriata TaxID=183589 RepID=A0A448Z653_9STRA|nr:unnamed protein product [Pseudo-nitzschia multistriata]
MMMTILCGKVPLAQLPTLSVVVLSLLIIQNFTTRCEANLKLPTFVASHMVLQREPLSSRIWGWADPGSLVRVSLDSKIYTDTNAQPDGSWIIELPPQPAGSDHKILIADGETSITLQDVAFGDVYLCSGQSNMELSLPAVFNASAEIEDSSNYPNLRLATVDKVTSDTPQKDAPSKSPDYAWARSGPDAMNLNDTFKYYSATCYFFGRELYKALDSEIPIGLVTSCWGGQTVETFSSPDALADKSCGGTRPVHGTDGGGGRNGTTVVTSGPGPRPTQLWNAMIHPLVNMRFAGSVWYQGESNAFDPESYACRFPAMIRDWRLKFGLSDLSFFFVQLAGFHGTKDDWPGLRAAQMAATQLPRVGYAAAIDLGDPSSPSSAIHPRRKLEVGRRLSLSARTIQYGERGGLVSTGPILAGVQQLPTFSTTHTIRLSFSPGTADGLHVHGSPECSLCCEKLPFRVLDANGTWSRVDGAEVRDSEIDLSSNVGPVFGVRYAWELYPECLVYNGEGGPDDHAGIAGAPWEWCSEPSGDPAWTGTACKVPASAKG